MEKEKFPKTNTPQYLVDNHPILCLYYQGKNEVFSQKGNSITNS